MSIENKITPTNVAPIVVGNTLLNADKTHSLVPDKARYLAQQLVLAAERAEKFLDDSNLLVPFNQNGITQLHHQRYLYEQQYSIKFTDLGEFVSHVVHKQLHKLS